MITFLIHSHSIRFVPTHRGRSSAQFPFQGNWYPCFIITPAFLGLCSAVFHYNHFIQLNSHPMTGSASKLSLNHLLVEGSRMFLYLPYSQSSFYKVYFHYSLHLLLRRLDLQFENCSLFQWSVHLLLSSYRSRKKMKYLNGLDYTVAPMPSDHDIKWHYCMCTICKQTSPQQGILHTAKTALVRHTTDHSLSITANKISWN